MIMMTGAGPGSPESLWLGSVIGPTSDTGLVRPPGAGRPECWRLPVILGSSRVMVPILRHALRLAPDSELSILVITDRYSD